MFAQRLIATTRYLGRSLADGLRTVQALLERFKAIEDLSEARGIALLREWLSAEQKAQFDALQYFDVIGCDSGKRYGIRHDTGTNLYELDDAGQPVMGWCFIPSGQLVAGDVMLAQKIALETAEKTALKIANRFPVRISQQNSTNTPRWRAY
jgi:hypothetical protein